MARSRPLIMTFAADVRDFLRGTKDVEESMDDVADSLESAASDSERFEDDFRGAMRAASRAADREGRKIEQDLDSVGDEFRDVGQEAGDEFKSNLSESLASGGSPAELITDSLAGLVGNLKGPIGIAAAGLAGIGAVAFQGLQQRAEQMQELIEGIGDVVRAEYDLIDGYADQAAQDRAIADWIEEHGEFLSDNKDILDDLGISVGEYAAGILLGGEHLDALNEKIAESEEGQSAVGIALGTNILKYDQVVGLVDNANREHERGADLLSVQKDALNGVYEAQGRLTAEAQRTADRWETILSNMRNTPDINIQGTITWYNTGPGKAYADRGSVDYSPGHAAVANLYNKAGGGTP